MNRYVMEYVDSGREQQVIFAQRLKEAKTKARRITKIRNISEHLSSIIITPGRAANPGRKEDFQPGPNWQY